jgi:olefin beta-lactone synthetase
MGDVGYLDEHDRIWFCGRKAERVQTANGTLLTVPCEAIFNNVKISRDKLAAWAVEHLQ